MSSFNPARRPHIDLPIPVDDGNIKTYRIYAPTAKVALIARKAFELGQAQARGEELTDEEQAELQLSDEEEEQFDNGLFGGLKQQMLDDGVDMVTFESVRQAMMIWIYRGRDLAAEFWNEFVAGDGPSEDDPKAQPPETTTKTASSRGSSRSQTKKTAAKRGQSRTSRSSGTGPSSKPTSTNATESTSPTTTS